MRRILISTLLLALVGCADDPRAEGGPPSELVPANALAVLRIASPEALDAELTEIGIPPTSTVLPFLGLLTSEGIDSAKPWYLVWAEDVDDQDEPLFILPIADPVSFEESLRGGLAGFTSSIVEDYALLGSEDLPELGFNPLIMGFAADIELHADLKAIQTAYADEIQQAKDSLRVEMEADMVEAQEDPSVPNLDPTAMGEMIQAEMDILFDILEQSEVAAVTLDLTGGDLGWAVKWTLESGSPWGNLVADQRPKEPSSLGRVDLNQSMAFWMNHDMSDNQELLEPFFKAFSSFMKGVDPEIFSQLAGQEVEGVMSGGWSENGMSMEAVYTLPDMELGEFRDLVREQMAGLELEMPGLEMEYQQNVEQLGDMEVDLFVQEIQVPEDAELPFPLNRTEAYYGWGEEEMFMVMRNGEGGAGELERLGELASRSPGPVPAHVQELLAVCPENLLMFGFLDLANLMQGLAAMAPTARTASLPEGFPPIVFYATSEGSQVIYGGSLDLETMMSAVSAMVASAMGG